MSQKNITLGTAGHIDHGKTALVRKLTGYETDRLKEEKDRGMSIELGFAPWKMAELEVGIVDVPGHESFVKTMVAGASGIDAVIFVVAADDGVMPQTREHLDILSLLGVKQGVVALTKVDMVLPERVDAVTQELRAFLRGTFLNDAPIFPLSNITGLGFEPLYEGLSKLVHHLTPKQTDGIFRLPVERAFSIKGYGTIVSGIPMSGTARLGDHVIVYPRAEVGRIKAIQVYQNQSEQVQCGQCAAINVPQWDHKVISRGDVITIEDWFSPCSWYLCELEMLALDGAYIKRGSSVKFHTGTSESTATIHMLEGDCVLSGERALVQVQLGRPVVAAPLDRFLVRSLSPAQTIGGGLIIEGLEQKLRLSRPEVVEDARRRAVAVQDDATFAEYVILTGENQNLNIKSVAQRIKKPLSVTENIVQALANTGAVLTLGQGLLVHARNMNEYKRQLLEMLAQYHQTNPSSPGMDVETCQSEFMWPKPTLHEILKEMESEGKIRLVEGRVCTADYNIQFDIAAQRRMQEVESLFLQRLFSPPEQKEITELCRLSPKDAAEILRILSEHGRLVRVSKEMYFHAEAVASARQAIVDHIEREKRLESVQFKYLINATRKYALPLLDYFDRIGITKRAPDNTRFLGPKA